MNLDVYVKLFKALGEPSRLKMLKLLSIRPMYVCEMENVLQMSQPRISQHLRVMKEAGLVKERKEAQRTFYALQIDFLDEQFKGLLQFLHADLENLPLFAGEYERFKELEVDSGVAQCKEGKVEAVDLKQDKEAVSSG